MIIGRVDDLGPAARTVYYTEVLRRVADVPGVTMAALNDYVLLTNEDDYEGVEIEGRPRLASGQWPREEWRRVSADYFRTLSIPIVRGRGFTPRDTAASPSVVIVNEAMAEVLAWRESCRTPHSAYREAVLLVGDRRHRRRRT